MLGDDRQSIINCQKDNMAELGGRDRLVGSQIIGLIALGMYDNPLAIYREYIQNAADAISTSVNGGNGRVTITIDPDYSWNRLITASDPTFS